MSKEELLELSGEVIEKLPNAMFRVKLENGVEILAQSVCNRVKGCRFRLGEFRDLVGRLCYLRIRQAKSGADVLENLRGGLIAVNKGVFVVRKVNPVIIGLKCKLLFLRLTLPHNNSTEKFYAVITEYNLVALLDIDSGSCVLAVVVVK